MNSVISWFLEQTKVGRGVASVQAFLDGKKQIIASVATAVPATALILKNFSDQGMPYLLQIAHTPEFLAASAGWMGLFNALKGEKIRQEIADVSATVQQTQGVVTPPAQPASIPQP